MESQRLHELVDHWLVEATISDIDEKLSNGEITSYELVQMYLARIGKLNKTINAVLEINPQALHIAQALDSLRKTKGKIGPLHGIPVLIKDNIDTGDLMHTSAGSLALANSYAPIDSFVAKCLRDAGAIILGKTNLTEWANFMTDNMPSGYSSRGGQVKNPYGEFDVGGSSSGTGAAIASNLATVGIGTETSGSILSPASQNSLVGIKPTVGLISRRGIIPISHSQDTAGPMTRTVKDAAILLSSLSVHDDLDPITLTNPYHRFDFTTCLDINGLSHARIGVCREVYFNYISDEKKEILNQAIDKMQSLGATIKDVVIPSLKRNWSYDVLLYEFKADLNAYLGKLAPSVKIRALSDLIEFNYKNSEKMLKYGQTLLIESDKTSGNLLEETYLKALEEDIYYSKEAGIDQLLKEEQLDVLVFPNNIGAGIPAKAGYPSITVPAGYTKDGEPVGMTFTSTKYSEVTLLKIAYAYEQATKVRVAPKL